ncbi:MAG: long-chain-fatty-acid--CoA ligase [Ilumatobacteraceae bacterium]
MKELVYHRLLLPVAEQFADRTATIDGTFTTTYGQHAERTLRLASALRHELHLAKSDRFAVMALNSHQYLELYHAAFLGGGVINPLNLRLAPKELEFIAQDSATRVCFVDQAFAPLVDKIRAETAIEHVVLIGGGDAPHDIAYEALLDGGKPELVETPEEDDVVILMYTGGTTGLPKGVVIDQRAATVNAYKIASGWPFSNDEVYLHQTPMFHAASFGGVLTVPAVAGLTTFVPMFEPSGVLDTIERCGVTTSVMVPTMIQMMLDHPSFRPERLASLRTLTYGASPMPGPLLDRLRETVPGLDLYQGYGMTESCGVLTCLRPADHRSGGDVLRSAGRPLLGTTISIQDDDGNVLPVGEVGEVCARSDNFMREYWNRPVETADAFAGDWYHSGDAGRLDENGYLFLVDRVKDMIVTGGENVYSSEVENALASHPAVAQVAVIGIPSEQWGEAVHAIVVLNPGETATEDDLKAWSRERIAGFKVPKSVEFRTEPLPLSGALKVLKRELRAPYWEGRERMVQ